VVCSGAAALRWARASSGGVGELQGEVVERFPGSVWAKGDRRWELRGSRTTATMAAALMEAGGASGAGEGLGLSSGVPW